MDLDQKAIKQQDVVKDKVDWVAETGSALRWDDLHCSCRAVRKGSAAHCDDDPERPGDGPLVLT